MIVGMDQTLAQLRDALDDAHLVLEVPGVAQVRSLREQLVNQLDDYLLPRYAEVDAPLLAVVGGSTGAGKSTLVNALVGAFLTRPGALRPTTRDPVLIHHPDDARWFTGPRVLPSLPRIYGDVPQRAETAPQNPMAGAPGAAAVRLSAHPNLRPGMALLDAPDVDSVVDTNRAVAAQLLAAADLWIFVTTANRYADAVPWQLLRDAARRQVVVAVVLDRVPPAVRAEVSHDLAAMLAAEGLAHAPLFVLAETELDAGGMLPPESVVDLRNWLDYLTSDAEARAAVVRQTLEGATTQILAQTQDVVAALEAQAGAADELSARIAEAYRTDAIEEALSDGAMLRGEVLARWQDFIGTGEFFRKLQSRVGRLRDQVSAFVTGRRQPEVEVEAAIGDGLRAVLVAEADAAAERARGALARDATGRDLLVDQIGAASEDFDSRAAEQIRQWQAFLLDLVRGQGQNKRTTARVLAFGVNGIGVALMIVVFASTGGLTGGEVAVAGGTGVVAQKLLEAVFGDQAVRRLAEAARADLADRVERLMAAEQRRFTDRLDPVRAAAAHSAVLAESAETVRAARDRWQG